MTLLFEADGREYIQRQARMIKARNALDADTLKAVLEEVPKFELDVGTRYKIRLLGGEMTMKHVHAQSKETGEIFGLDVPEPVNPTYQEIEGTYEGRVPPPSPWVGLMIFRSPDGSAGLVADIDIMRLIKLEPDNG